MNTTAEPETDRTSEIPVATGGAARAIAVWLFACCGMVILMMLIGAVTRLTESGLSMVEWRPLIGVLPPLSEAEWERVFALYRKTSEYRLQNPDMTLDAFKTIFWWEYIHRVWGRLIGVAFAVPLLWFVVRRRIPRGLAPRLVGLFLLGGAQGVIGWWMVKSGFVDRDDVSQYRLTVHLGTAFVILGYMLWIAIGLVSRARAGTVAAGLRRNAKAVLLVVFATALTGGLVAGLNAGFTYNEWPMMDGRFVPDGYGDLSPWWLNPFDNIPAVQFDHRMMAYLTAAAVLALWLQARAGGLPAGVMRPFHLLGALAALQVGLGIATLLLVVPLPLAVMHQAGAIALFCTAVWCAQAVSR